MRVTAGIRASHRSPLLQVVKSAIAIAASWLIAGLLIPGEPPVFAAIAALLVVAPSLNQSLTKAVERSIGVFTGVVIASLLGILLGGSTWVILLATVTGLLIAWALRLTPGSTNQVAISALLVLALGTATPAYAVNRVLETLIGAVIGILVNLALVPPVAVAPARNAVMALGNELANSLERLAGALESPQSAGQLHGLLVEARLMRPMKDAADAAIEVGTESLSLNPRGRRHREDLAAVQALLDRLGPIVTQTVGMTRAFADHYDPTIADEPAVQAIAEQLRRAAHDVRLEVRRTDAAPLIAEHREEPAALTAPLRVSTPSSDHWVLIGSMLEDLRRIHEALEPAS
ncbi:aromatic acid exporter family protein [Microbacterium sp. zg.B48]|uniref:FUSC family protein n=1 Tax=unclassified Microbacterium TaxID=2609290 RepID=UPI00214A9E77|nr:MULTISPECIES: FUSC family protein [unclassified Microbacterium]MCR2763473.1 aromatic acid exporter family protein [Microbacterium sp. zg.B48]MCR2809194.1 aromatic acid exporter family protein [Microbacterium sp. zg.B185]WIM20342.1 aromatic acid exporter family protein [Microbacterium sp. zg-B185]